VAGAIARSIADAAATVQNCTLGDPSRTAEQRVRDLAELLDAAVARNGVEWLVGRPPP
jgi:hypothetical protein